MPTCHQYLISNAAQLKRFTLDDLNFRILGQDSKSQRWRHKLEQDQAELLPHLGSWSEWRIVTFLQIIDYRIESSLYLFSQNNTKTDCYRHQSWIEKITRNFFIANGSSSRSPSLDLSSWWAWTMTLKLKRLVEAFVVADRAEAGL